MEYQLLLLAVFGLVLAGQHFIRNPVIQRWVRIGFLVLLVLAGFTLSQVGIYTGG